MSSSALAQSCIALFATCLLGGRLRSLLLLPPATALLACFVGAAAAPITARTPAIIAAAVVLRPILAAWCPSLATLYEAALGVHLVLVCTLYAAAVRRSRR